MPRSRSRTAVVLIPLVVAAALIAAVLLRRTSSPSTGPRYAAVGGTVTPGSLPGIQTGLLPWPPEVAHLLARLRAIALPWLASEGTALHIHQHLDLFVDGRRVPVPADVGISATGGFLAPIHTHDASGVIHVESSTRRAFTLGELFDVWGVRFTDSCLGGYCTGGGRTLRVFVDGHAAAGDFRRLELFAHEEIAVVYGTDAELPRPVPARYSFQFGL